MSCLNSQDWMVEGVIRLPSLVSAKLAIAQAHDWGALVDAYLVDAAEVAIVSLRMCMAIFQGNWLIG